jgi:hypothetical protein
MRSKTSWQISCALPSKLARCHPGWNARAKATSLMAIFAGLGTSVMSGQRSPDDAPHLIRYTSTGSCPRSTRSASQGSE